MPFAVFHRGLYFGEGEAFSVRTPQLEKKEPVDISMGEERARNHPLCRCSSRISGQLGIGQDCSVGKITIPSRVALCPIVWQNFKFPYSLHRSVCATLLTREQCRPSQNQPYVRHKQKKSCAASFENSFFWHFVFLPSAAFLPIIAGFSARSKPPIAHYLLLPETTPLLPHILPQPPHNHDAILATTYVGRLRRLYCGTSYSHNFFQTGA